MIFLNQIRISPLSGIELVTVDLTSEYMGVGSEYRFFRIFPPSIRDKIERGVYNYRKRKLFYFREQMEKRLTAMVIPYEHSSTGNAWMKVK